MGTMSGSDLGQNAIMIPEIIHSQLMEFKADLCPMMSEVMSDGPSRFE